MKTCALSVYYCPTPSGIYISKFLNVLMRARSTTLNFFGAVIKTLTVAIAVNIVMVVSVYCTGNWGNTDLAVLYMAGKVKPLLSIGIQEG